MKVKSKSAIHFYIDPIILSEDKGQFLLRFFNDEKMKYQSELKNVDDFHFNVIFTVKKNIRQFSHLKNKLLVIDSNENQFGTFEVINFNSMEDITSFIKKVFIVQKRINIKNRLKDSLVIYEEIKNYNQNLKSLELVPVTNEAKKDLEAILDLELLLLQEESIQQWNGHFKNFSKKNSKTIQISLLSHQEILGDQVIDENSLLFLLPFNQIYLHLKVKNLAIEEHAQSIELLLTMVLRTLQIQDQQLIKSDGEIDFWKKIFSKIPYPMSVISDLGDLLIYNESFAKIGILPKECLRFKDQESLELYQQFYKIRRIDFPINLISVSYFVFYTIDTRQQGKDVLKTTGKKGNVDELGIISSSIAHELNNPLAGILAALSLLQLEDDWSQEAKADLDDMKNGAKRCKELVEIFLGFSKFSPTAVNAPSIKHSLDQAINLLRFRMIESNLRLDFRYSPTLETFSHQVNASIMSMILYLIISELMTSFAHERLITQSHVGVMAGEVQEFSNQIFLKLEHDFEYEEKIAQSKLIQHLLVFEKLEINFLRKEIRLIYRS